MDGFSSYSLTGFILLDGSVCPVGLGWVGTGGWVGISHLFASRLGVWGGVKVE